MILATSTPVFAADNSASSLRIMPLPLSTPDATRVQGNPFCEPELSPLASPNIRLASDSQAPAIRLKPIGVVVGLRSIGDPHAPAPPEILIAQPTGSAVQSNPLIGSIHHNEEPSAEVIVDEPADFTASVDVSEGEPASAASPDHNALVADELEDGDTVVVAEPFSFSMSDADPITPREDAIAVDSSEMLDSEDTLAEGSPPVSSAEPLMAIDIAETPGLPLKQLPRTTDVAEMPRVHSAMPPHGMGVKKSEDRGAVASTVSSAQRYRPPVAVSSPPLSIVRNDSIEGISLVRPTVTRVESYSLSPEPTQSVTRPTEPSSLGSLNPIQTVSASVDLHMTKTQVRTLTIGGNFRRVAVADQAVCQAVTSGTSELKLIGTGRGITNLTVWADTGDGQEPKMRVFRVHVGDATDTSGEAVGDKTETLNQSIARAFSKCRVHVRQSGGQLIVTGDCDNQDSAASILRMVRKTCLIPVVDELRIR